MTLQLSQSEITVYNTCKRQWWLRYYSHGEDPMDVLTRGLTADLEAYPEKWAEVADQGSYAEAIVTGYVEWLEETGADADLRVVGVEDEVSVPLESVPGVELLGKRDLRLLRESDGARLFMDHKVVQSLDEIPKTAQLNTQFKHYALLDRLLLPEGARADGGIYNMLRKSKRTARAKPPFYGRHEVRHNDHTLRAYYLQVTEIAKQILALRERLDAGEDGELICAPNPTRDCSWKCPFVRTCGMHDDGSDVESVYRLAFEVGNPNERYALSEWEVE